MVAAANHGHIEAVNLLVDHISDTDSTGHGLSDALHAVADCDSSETGLLIMRNLLDKGAVASGTYGEDALITAMTRDRRDMVQLLFRHGVQQSSKIEAVVSSAIESGQLDLVRLAAEHEVPLVPHEYSDVLRLKSGDDQEMWKLLRKRARGFPGKYQITQIVRAVRLDFIQQLLEDTSEDLSDKFDMSAMIAGNHFEFVKALLERGAKPTWNTDISPAVAGHQFELVEMLLPNVKYNPSSFEVAVNTCQSDMLDLMTKHASEEAFRLFQDFIPRLVAQNQPEKLMLLLKHQPSCGAWLNSVNSELLRRPVARGWLDLVRLLLEHGARPWAGTLLRAVTNDHVEMVTLLIKHGASVDVHRERFVYALGAAAARGGPNFEVIASMLLGKGADINMIDKDNRSALGEAVKYGHENVVRYLLQRGAYPTGTEDPYQGSSCDVNPHEMARRKSRIEPERYTTIFKLLDNEVKLAKTKLAKKYKEERANMTLWTKVKSYWQ